MLLFSMQRSVSGFEFNVRKALLYFFIVATVSWFAAVTSFYLPQLFVHISLLAVAAYIITPVLYYRFVYVLTQSDNLKRFSAWHYLFPCLILIGLLFLPGFGYSQSAVYHRNVVFELLFIILYSVLSLRRIMSSYKAMRSDEKKVNRPVRWMLVLVNPLVVTAIITVYALILPAGAFFSSEVTIVLMILFISLYSILGYNVLRDRLLPCSVNLYDKTVPGIVIADSSLIPPKRMTEVITDDQERQGGKLTQKRFEEYIYKNKPYLNPRLKITELIEPLKVNRTVISNFVNQTYGMNFNQYINSLRLKELDRLMALPSNGGKKLPQLIEKAGFASMRNYTRALAAKCEK